MRDILFRGKTKAHNKWVYGWYCGKILNHDMSSTEESSQIIDDKTLYWHTCEPETCGQFTGLTDKNGKKIFDGDVVKFTDSPFGYSYIGVVCFNEGSFCIKYEYWKKEKFHRIGQTDKWQDMGASGIVTYQYEILGNIHDNPELLENP